MLIQLRLFEVTERPQEHLCSASVTDRCKAVEILSPLAARLSEVHLSLGLGRETTQIFYAQLARRRNYLSFMLWTRTGLGMCICVEKWRKYMCISNAVCIYIYIYSSGQQGCCGGWLVENLLFVSYVHSNKFKHSESTRSIAPQSTVHCYS